MLKGRCARCWGNLVARHDKTGQCTLITCRVCGASVEGAKAADAFLRMETQTMRNLENLELGRAPRYDDGDFIKKIFPQFETLPKGDFDKRLRGKLGQRKQGGKLTRHDFPPGSPGLLFFQARVLLAGIAGLSNPDEVSVADVPHVDVMDDGSLAMAPTGSADDPHSGDRLWNRMGTTMIESMTAAFACELAIKAICLTRSDEAPKCHDLVKLHDSLPASSKQRIATDYPQIVDTLQAGRHIFGDWRYFEKNVGGAGLQPMFDVPLAHALGKAARVILDEGVMVGLSAVVDLDTTDNVHIVRDTANHRLQSKITVKGREASPLTDTLQSE